MIHFPPDTTHEQNAKYFDELFKKLKDVKFSCVEITHPYARSRPHERNKSTLSYGRYILCGDHTSCGGKYNISDLILNMISSGNNKITEHHLYCNGRHSSAKGYKSHGDCRREILLDLELIFK